MLIGDGYAIKGNVEKVKGDKKALKLNGEKLKGNGEVLKGDEKVSQSRYLAMVWWRCTKRPACGVHGDKEPFKGNWDVLRGHRKVFICNKYMLKHYEYT